MATNQAQSKAARVDEKLERIDRQTNSSHLSWIQLESTWWGNEKLGQWNDEWFVQIDAETEKAIHVSEATTGAPDFTSPKDAWLPKSKVDRRIDPDTELHEPDGETRGTVEFGREVLSQYGPKTVLLGDTYDALVEEDLKEELDWETTHHSFDGDNWTVDAEPSAHEELIETLTEAGFAVEA